MPVGRQACSILCSTPHAALRACNFGVAVLLSDPGKPRIRLFSVPCADASCFRARFPNRLCVSPSAAGDVHSVRHGRRGSAGAKKPKRSS